MSDDFEGIIAGAPANNWTHTITGHLWNERALLDDPAGTIPQAKLPAIQRAAVAQCDGLDGVTDGLIEDPRGCHFDPAAIQCKGADEPNCLTAPQVTTLRKIYAGPKNPRTGAQIHPGYSPGAEGLPDTWATWIVPAAQRASLQFGFANTYYGQAVFEDANWDFAPDKDAAHGDDKAGPVLNSVTPTRRSGSWRKLIQYHGWGYRHSPAEFHRLLRTGARVFSVILMRAAATRAVDDF
jgi:feruloyl esterase